MSKISKAIERARQDRELRRAGVVTQAERDRLVEAVEKSAAEAGRSREDYFGMGLAGAPRIAEARRPLAPAYTSTEIFPLDGLHLEEHRVISGLEDHRVRDSYDILRTEVLQRTKPKGWNSIMITSVGPGEGKTLTAINLALSIAREARQTALLVGTNFRSPRINEYLGLDPARKGLSEYLTGNEPLSGLLVNPGIPKLVVLPTGSPAEGSTDLIASPRMRDLVAELKARYADRYVLYDAPHLLDRPDALVFADYVDAVLLVVGAGASSRVDIARAMRLLEGRNVVGMVMNSSRQRTVH
jgi:capsular exopolysaccharide synthesis family protein